MEIIGKDYYWLVNTHQGENIVNRLCIKWSEIILWAVALLLYLNYVKK